MVNVTSDTIIPVRLSFYSKKSLFRLNFRIDYIKATELLDRLPTVHQPDLANTVEFVFYFEESSHLSLHCSIKVSIHISRQSWCRIF